MRDRLVLGPTEVLLVAALVFYVLLLAIGPISVVDAMPDLDLGSGSGSGISMTPDGQVKLKNDAAATPMHIGEQSEYEGITMP